MGPLRGPRSRLLSRLRVLLEDDDTDAPDFDDEFLPLLAGSVQAGLLARLAHQIDDFAFEEARDVLAMSKRKPISFDQDHLNPNLRGLSSSRLTTRRESSNGYRQPERVLRRRCATSDSGPRASSARQSRF